MQQVIRFSLVVIVLVFMGVTISSPKLVAQKSFVTEKPIKVTPIIIRPISPISFVGRVTRISVGGFTLSSGRESFNITVFIQGDPSEPDQLPPEGAAFLVKVPKNYESTDDFKNLKDLMFNLIYALNREDLYTVTAVEDTPPNHEWKVYYLTNLERQ